MFTMMTGITENIQQTKYTSWILSWDTQLLRIIVVFITVAYLFIFIICPCNRLNCPILFELKCTSLKTNPLLFIFFI